jgi:putative toxin-antitoxin system antitoxin component (TIGR02293 family)
MKNASNIIKPFNTRRSVVLGSEKSGFGILHKLPINTKIYQWANGIERLDVIRGGMPFESLVVLSKKMNIPIKSLLFILDIPQTTYNKKKTEASFLDRQKSELVVMIIELLDFGIEVFNNEADKFQRWLQKPNISLGGNNPISFFDTITGIQEVKNCLNRIEYGNYA